MSNGTKSSRSRSQNALEFTRFSMANRHYEALKMILNGSARQQIDRCSLFTCQTLKLFYRRSRPSQKKKIVQLQSKTALITIILFICTLTKTISTGGPVQSARPRPILYASLACRWQHITKIHTINVQMALIFGYFSLKLCSPENTSVNIYPKSLCARGNRRSNRSRWRSTEQ